MARKRKHRAAATTTKRELNKRLLRERGWWYLEFLMGGSGRGSHIKFLESVLFLGAFLGIQEKSLATTAKETEGFVGGVKSLDLMTQWAQRTATKSPKRQVQFSEK